MSVSSTRLRKGLILGSGIVSFGIIVILNWLLFFLAPYILTELYFSGPSIQGFNIYTGYFTYFAAPLRWSVYLAIGGRALYTVRELLQSSVGWIIPPYDDHSPNRPQVPTTIEVSSELSQLKWRRALQGFGLSLVWMVVLEIVYIRYLMFNPTFGNLIQKLPDEFLLSLASFLVSAPIGALGQSVFGPMNQETLVATIFLILLPIPPLTIGILNLNSLIYDFCRARAFSGAVSIHQICKKGLQCFGIPE